MKLRGTSFTDVRPTTQAVEAVFRARGLTKVYHMGEVEVHAHRGVDLELFRGEFVVLLGPSGSGRSTLLKAAHELERARAALVASSTERPCAPCDRTPIRAPAGGRVLRLVEECERIVPTGTPVLEVGDPSRLEVVTDLLSTDAVRVRPGDTMVVEDWGGARPLRARVRTVEPSGFTKISALGVEEQRVNVVADLMDEPGPLGDRYRVEVRVVLWGAADVLKAPLSSLIRRGEGWAVMLVQGGRARLRPVTLGHRGEFEVEIVQGLDAGEELIRFPSDLIRDGSRVRPRTRT
jgi:HlyD family secretion protein